MKERPILFSAPMIRALLAGTKTQTRRIVKLAESVNLLQLDSGYAIHSLLHGIRPLRCPYAADDRMVHLANGWEWQRSSLPSIHLPRWASRITLEVTGVRVERLQDISEEDARAEGISKTHLGEWGDLDGNKVTGRPWAHSFFIVWNEINGRESWDANPWVWVVEFRRVEAMERAA